MIQELTVLGLMSGTSLDGLDLCCVRFKQEDENYVYEILHAETQTYDAEWCRKLASAFHMPPDELKKLDAIYGLYCTELVQQFIAKFQLEGKIDLVGSHGHTIFHQPDKGVTVQIGSGQVMADTLGIPVICDFRIKDVQLGGQGAPLVPIGDKYLFGSYSACLNLGGIANISFDKLGQRIAFDICPANLPLNKQMEARGEKYDHNGQLAKSGSVNTALLDELNQLDFYEKRPPKSLGVEWLYDSFYPLLDRYELTDADLLRTIVEHETDQIARVLNDNFLTNCMVSGGGAFNQFFVDRLQEKTSTKIILPETEIIAFKEALVFAFLAFLNANGQVNTLSTVTGASSDSIGGFLFSPNP